MSKVIKYIYTAEVQDQIDVCDNQLAALRKDFDTKLTRSTKQTMMVALSQRQVDMLVDEFQAKTKPWIKLKAKIFSVAIPTGAIATE